MSVAIQLRVYWKVDNIMEKVDKRISNLERVILEAITESGMAQSEIAGKSGIDQSLLSRFMEQDFSKRRTLTLPVADRLIAALGIKVIKPSKPIGAKKMRNVIPFRKNVDIAHAKSLCQHPIAIRRGKMVCETILHEIDSGLNGLTEETRDWLSKWVNPAREEKKVQPFFDALSTELFGHRIARKI